MNQKIIYFGIILTLIIIPLSMSDKIFAVSNTVSGTLKDSSGNPLIVKIELVNGSNNYNTVSSRIDGSFALSVPTNSYTLKFSSVNQTSNMPRFFEVEKHVTVSSSTTQNIMPSIANISVNIKDSSGNNIQGAILDSGIGHVFLGGFNGTEQDISTTDSNGNVNLHLLPATFSNVKITLPNGETVFPTGGRIVTVSGNANYNLQLSSNPTVSGTIKDSSGNPVLTLIELVGADYVDRTQTDNTGAFSFTVPTGSYIVKFSQLYTNQTNIPKYFDAEKPVTIPSSITENLVAPIVSVSGQINQTSMPIKVRENLLNGGFTGFSLDDVKTDSSGHFTAKLIQSTDPHVTIQINGTNVFFRCTLSGTSITC